MMDEEDKLTAIKQLTSYDRFANWNRILAVVAVPPKAPNTQEKWVAVNGIDGFVDPTIRQPDPERKALCGRFDQYCFSYCLSYWYADELPRCITLTVVFAVIFSILTTPLVLLCFMPMIRRMKKVYKQSFIQDFEFGGEAV